MVLQLVEQEVVLVVVDLVTVGGLVVGRMVACACRAERRVAPAQRTPLS